MIIITYTRTQDSIKRFMKV